VKSRPTINEEHFSAIDESATIRGYYSSGNAHGKSSKSISRILFSGRSQNWNLKSEIQIWDQPKWRSFL